MNGSRSSKYSYTPAPLGHVPPIGPNYLTHLYHHPEAAENDRCKLLPRFPKKVEERLVYAHQDIQMGWGIHFVEGWKWDRIWMLLLVLFLLGSLAFAVCWWLLEHDLQGAFAVASYVITFLTLVVGTAQVRMHSPSR